MSVKSKISSLSKLYSFYEKIPENYLDESDVDAYFYHNILDITPSQHRIFRVGKGPNNNLFAFKVFQFCDLIYKQKYILEEEIIVTKQELALILDNLRNFLKKYDIACKQRLYTIPKPKQELGNTLGRDDLFSHYNIEIQQHPNRKFRLSFRFEDNNCCFSVKKFKKSGEQYILVEIVNITHKEIYNLYKKRSHICTICGIVESSSSTFRLRLRLRLRLRIRLRAKYRTTSNLLCNQISLKGNNRVVT